ncbi:MAG: anthranilate synthase component I family protein [Methanolinea sp.]|nr:anthranilate synthase component I family protein [Methanolinea sp.]
MPAADPFTLYSAIGKGGGCILESVEGIPRRAVRSFVCPAPPVAIAQGDTVTYTGDRAIIERLEIPQARDPVALLRDLCGQIRCTAVPGCGFAGGFIGYIAYDAVTALSGGRVDAGRDRYLARFMLCTRGVVYDHVAGSCTLFENVLVPPGGVRGDAVGEARENLLSLREEVEAVTPRQEGGIPPPGDLPPLASHPDREGYTGAVERALRYIREGDIFQVVLSRKVTCPSRADPLSLYGAMRAINPSPYLYCFRFDDEAVIGSSPEMLVRVEGREVRTVPIAGTRPRGRDTAEDDALAMDLLSDQKERAEHLMLVDLARNDVGKVAAFGSVEVPVFMEVERFSHVQHIISAVRGTLREGCDRFDALAACFPAGTVSGAPKERAMQIIAELEGHPRGLYAGAVGYAAFCGPLEFAIAIRTLVAREGRIEFSAGAGIVADSLPEREFEETEAKARAMVEAIRRAGVAG